MHVCVPSILGTLVEHKKGQAGRRSSMEAINLTISIIVAAKQFKDVRLTLHWKMTKANNVATDANIRPCWLSPELCPAWLCSSEKPAALPWHTTLLWCSASDRRVMSFLVGWECAPSIPHRAFMGLHVGWEVRLPCEAPAAYCQTGGKLSPRAVVKQEVS